MTIYGPQTVSAPAGAIIVHPGDNVSAIVNGAPAGATFYFEAGTYRGVSLTPKEGQTFIGAEGAVLNGSTVLNNFAQQGSYWVVNGQTQEGFRHFTEWGDGVSMRAGYPDTVYVNDKPLTPVDSLSKLTSDTFYFDYAADKIYIADNPAGKKVEAGTLDHAFEGNANGVTVQNFVIEKYASPAQTGAIHGQENWTIANNEVRLNYGLGIYAEGDSKIVGNYVHDNGQMGLGSGLSSSANNDNILVEGNEIARNGWWSGIDVFWEGGGAKFRYSDGLIVRDNYSHDNKGFGLWTDIDNINTLYEGNIVVHNSGGGITHEISYDATIRNNVLMGNGYQSQGDGWMWGGQIQIQNSKNVDIYGNQIDMTGAEGGNGIGLIQQNRGSGAYGAHTTTGNTIHDNTIVSTDGNGKIGGAADYNESGMLNGGNVWSNNHYFLAGDNQFRWGSADTFAEFKAVTGETSVISRTFPDTASWLDAVGSGGGGGVVATPAISSFSNDTGTAGDRITSDNTLTLAGTATANSTVNVYDETALLGTATVNGSGAWSYTTSTLANGTHSFSATARDAAGNTSAASAGLGVTVDTMAPAAPAISSFSNDTGIVGDRVTSDNTLTLAGTAAANSTVNVYDETALLGTATVNGSGAWSYTTSTLSNGAHSFSATARDAAGNTSAASAGLGVTVDTMAPAAPAISSFSNDTGIVGDRVTSDNTLTLAGTAAANSTVSIYDGTTLLGTAAVDGSGAWSYATATLSNSPHNFSATARDVAGNTSAASVGFSVTVDTAAPTAPVTPTAPKINSFSKDTGTVGDHITSDNTLTLTGTAAAHSKISVYDGTTLLGTATANGSGAWSYTTAALSNGAHTFSATSSSATARDVAGSTSAASAGLSVTVDTVVPTAPKISSFSNDTGTVGDRITTDNTLTFTGTAAANSTVSVYDGKTLLGTAVANDSGAWSHTTATLSNGSHSFSTTARDVAGNTSAPSATLGVTVDTAAPTIRSFSNETGKVGDHITSDNTATANSKFSVSDGATLLGAATANGSGAWSHTTASQSNNVHSFSADTTDVAASGWSLWDRAELRAGSTENTTAAQSTDSLSVKMSNDTSVVARSDTSIVARIADAWRALDESDAGGVGAIASHENGDAGYHPARVANQPEPQTDILVGTGSGRFHFLSSSAASGDEGAGVAKPVLIEAHQTALVEKLFSKAGWEAFRHDGGQDVNPAEPVELNHAVNPPLTAITADLTPHSADIDALIHVDSRIENWFHHHDRI